MAEAKAAKQAKSTSQTSTAGQAQASSCVEEREKQPRAASAASSPPLPSASQKEELKRKLKRIRAEKARKGASTPLKPTQGGQSERTAGASSRTPLPPATNETSSGFLTQVSAPNIDSPAFSTQVSATVAETPQAPTSAQQKELEQARIRSRKNMNGLITSRESWLELRRMFCEFNELPEPSETVTVFGREVDCWDLWSEVVEVGYPPSPAAWVLIAEGLGFVDDQELREEGERSVVQALKEGFEGVLEEFWFAVEWFAGERFQGVEVVVEEEEE